MWSKCCYIWNLTISVASSWVHSENCNILHTLAFSQNEHIYIYMYVYQLFCLTGTASVNFIPGMQPLHSCRRQPSASSRYIHAGGNPLPPVAIFMQAATLCIQSLYSCRRQPSASSRYSHAGGNPLPPVTTFMQGATLCLQWLYRLLGRCLQPSTISR